MDGWKGDLLVLFGLNLLMETHCIVHLSNGQIWTTLATTGQTHSEDLKKCDIHLIYVEWGLFVELTEWDVLLVIAEVTDKHSPIIIGELSAVKEKSIDAVMKTGLGIGLAHPKLKPKPMPEPTPSASAGSKQELTHVERELQDPTSKVKLKKDTSPQLTNPPEAVDSKMVTRDIQIKVAKLSMEPDERLHVSEKLLVTYPVSKVQTC